MSDHPKKERKIRALTSKRKWNVVCWNVNDCLRQSKPKCRRRILEILVQHFKPTHVNVLILQEVMRRKDLSWLLSSLANLTQRYWFGTKPHSGGMCVVSDHLPQQSLQINCPIRDSFSNGLVGLCIGDVWWLSVHLDSRDYLRCETLRLEETKWILKEVDKLKSNAVVLSGDWNSVSHLDSHLTNDTVRCRAVSKTNPCVSKSCNPHALPSKLLEEKGFADVLLSCPRANNVGTWIPSAWHERIDRMYVKGDGIVPVHMRTVHQEQWPTGKDHRLLQAEFKKCFFSFHNGMKSDEKKHAAGV